MRHLTTSHFLQVALVNGATTHLLFTLSHPALPEASPVVSDFTISAYGSSCKYISFQPPSSYFASCFYLLASNPALREHQEVDD